ncbi:MAG: glutamine-hydrolyzing carbamoyl-phosphate synthase small subunit [Candidatus Hydrothermarchaeales archaeon]
MGIPMHACLVLEDGTTVKGEGFGAEKEVLGEVVFNTSMTGYQEALTDPSYKGQILILTYPLIGNYGVNTKDYESDRIKVEGFAVREYCHFPSHRKGEKTINQFLKENGKPGIAGIDTRALTIKIRKYGTMKGALKTSKEEIDSEELLFKAKKQPDISEKDLVKLVTSPKIERYEQKSDTEIVLLDCGMKLSILKNLLLRDANVTVVPATTTSKEILDLEPNGIMVTNGPGDPLMANYVVNTLKDLLEELPISGICFGNQLLALAAGGKTYKLKFGHRGSNQPVKDLATRRVYITSQNHGFAVDGNSLGGTGFEVSHINPNDNSVEGMIHKELPIFSVQYHPEAHPGPWDSNYIFDEFLKSVRKNNAKA